jgi:DNA-binding GntR family transcriptional regulator
MIICADARGKLRRWNQVMMDSIAKSALPVTPLPRGTLQDHVHRQLCELILNGEIAPGQLITIQAIADAFGVSSMPVREALQRLTAARVLTVISGRSIGIPRLTAERMLDLRRVRLEVEAIAADWAAQSVTNEQVQRLEETLKNLEEAVRSGDRKQYVRLNRAFHFGIYAAAGSEVLLAIIENLWLQISPYFHLLHASGNYPKANAQHEMMLEGLKCRDGAAVRQAICNDIKEASRILAELLEVEDPASATISSSPMFQRI